MGYKEEFISIYREKIHREGSARLLEWLEKTDFFDAPASTKFHCACKGGLVQHSVNVYRVLMEKHFDPETDNEETFALCALLHDICKAQFYKESTRNVKNDETWQVGEGPLLSGGRQLSLWPWGKIGFSHRAFSAAEEPARPWLSAGTWGASMILSEAAALL